VRVTHFGSQDINFPDAQCKYTDPDIFFPTIYNGRERISQANKTAIEICKTCVHEVDCAAYAIVDPELYGIWGGTTMADRKQLRKKYRIKGIIKKEMDIDSNGNS
jgi:WhiB family redox-sensing transcriptional regulator